MPFNQKPQKFNAKINAVTIGSGDKTVTSAEKILSRSTPLMHRQRTHQRSVLRFQIWVWMSFPKV